MEFELCKEIKKDEAEKLNLKEYQAELKYDGTRCLIVISKGRIIRGESRRGEEKISKYGFDNFSDDKIDVILDGEICVLNGFKTNLTDVQKRQNWTKASYVVFDILFLGGQDLKNKPLSERRKILEQFFATYSPRRFKLSPIFEFSELWRVVEAHELEGVILKPKNSLYSGGRKYWLKCKFWKEVRLLIEKYEESIGGIVLLDGKDRIALNGQKAEQVRQILDRGEAVAITVQYLEKTNSGLMRMPTCKEIKKI